MPFHLRGPSGKDFPVTGVIDSGADVSLFPADWAEPLGIQIADCQMVPGMSASGGACEIHVWKEPLHAVLLGRKFELTPAFGGTNEVLLGRDDFFMQFEARFNQQKKRFSLKAF